MWSAILLLAAGSNVAEPDPAEGYEQISYEAVAERISGCGVESIAIEFDDLFQSDVIRIGDPELTDSQLQCIVRATRKTFYDVMFEGPFLGRYHEIREEVAWPETRARLEAFFAERPHLGPVPVRREGETDDQLAKRIEAFCGPEADGAFGREFGVLTISRQWLGPPEAIVHRDHRMFGETFGCVLNAAVLSGLDVHFIGNEKIRETEGSEDYR